MKSIHEASREERLERALLAIEGLTFLQNEEDPFACQVYRIAHAASGRCGAADHHDATWLEEIESVEKMLSNANIMCIAKIMGV